MHKLIFLIPFLVLASSASARQESCSTKIEIKGYAVKMGETVLKKYPDIWSIDKYDDPHWTYTYGLLCSAMYDLWLHTNDARYFTYAKSYLDALIDENGLIHTYKKEDYNIDKLNSGKILFKFYKASLDERYKIALDTLRTQLIDHPRTEIGGFWHKKRYPHQMWLDGLYMGGPFYAEYAREFNEPESMNEVVAWYINMEKVARDPKTGLLYHGWDESKNQEWADKTTGLSSNFWGRGMGWYAMALVDLLDYLPGDHPQYNSIVAIINRLATAILDYQDKETSVWYQVVDQGGREGNYLEGSVSAMFSYFLLKGVNMDYLDKKIFLEPAKKAFEGTVKNLIRVESDSSLIITPVCAVAGLGGDPYRDGSYEYYVHEMQRDNDPKAVGPFIMAAIQYEELTK